MPNSISIPILPSRDLDKSCIFYRGLGFDCRFAGDNYLIATFEGVELHFTLYQNIEPETNEYRCYIRTDNVEYLFNKMKAAGLPSDGIPRLTHIENKPWGMREYAVIDLDGTLISIGEILK